MAEQVELAQVISQLRQELNAAMREGKGEGLRFELGPNVRPGRPGWTASGLVDPSYERRPTMPRWPARPH